MLVVGWPLVVERVVFVLFVVCRLLFVACCLWLLDVVVPCWLVDVWCLFVFLGSSVLIVCCLLFCRLLLVVLCFGFDVVVVVCCLSVVCCLLSVVCLFKVCW